MAIVVRGGQGKLEELRDSLRQGGAFSVISRPGAEVDVLAASVRNNQIRTTTLRAVVAAGERLVPTFGAHEPPNHCDLIGLTAEQLDSILGEAVLNPIPQERRWRGNR